MSVLINAEGGPSMIACAFNAPLVAVRTRDRCVLHAVTMDEIIKAWPVRGKRKRLPVAACGTAAVRLYPGPEKWGRIVPFPPQVKGLPEGYTRCRACFEATGRKRPRVKFEDAS